MLKNPHGKYLPFKPINLPDRQWPNKVITAPPVWMSTDLRDGNQALFEPMDGEKKMRMFKLLCDIGLKEIEAGFPSASQTEFDFFRTLIEGKHIPDDVTIEALTQARDPLIRRTVEAMVGCRRGIVHVYNATSDQFREVVFNTTRDEVKAMAVNAVKLVKELTAQHPETEWVLQYSAETFSDTDLDFAKEVVDAVTEAWGATPSNKVIINLPASVEVATPNIYADKVEWMHRNLARRDSIILSLHPHNDRGTAVAAAELGIMAGADRVEGCLFGNGERTGNVDLVTLGLNLYTQGIHPGLDFSDINTIARVAEHCTQLPIHPRHPWVGDLVYTAFSGSHQDAIKKGFALQKPDAKWNVPYMPMDPADVGRSYDSVIRVNSQSGKGGIAYLLETEYGVVMSRRLQVEFSRVVQEHTDKFGGEVSAADIWKLFSDTYLETVTPVRYVEHHLFESGTDSSKSQGIKLVVEHNGIKHVLNGEGNGPIDAAAHALQQIGVSLKVRSYEERSMSSSNDAGDARACAMMEVATSGDNRECFGVGIDGNIVTASIKALISSANRVAAQGQASKAA